MKHLNFKLDDIASAVFESVRKKAADSLGFEPSHAQLVGMALKALERELETREQSQPRAKKGGS